MDNRAKLMVLRLTIIRKSQCGINLQLELTEVLDYLMRLINLNCKIFLPHVLGILLLFFSTMSHTIRRFNPFNLQHGSDDVLHSLIQDIIDYAESRLWSIVNAISKADKDRQSWTQKLLQKELVAYHFFLIFFFLTSLKYFVLSYVGIASAIGQIIDIPIIIRSLADSICFLDDEDFPINFDEDFLRTLDIGKPDRAIITFERAWWNGRKPRSLNLAEILDISSIRVCLESYKKQRQLQD